MNATVYMRVKKKEDNEVLVYPITCMLIGCGTDVIQSLRSCGFYERIREYFDVVDEDVEFVSSNVNGESLAGENAAYYSCSVYYNVFTDAMIHPRTAFISLPATPVDENGKIGSFTTLDDKVAASFPGSIYTMKSVAFTIFYN